MSRMRAVFEMWRSAKNCHEVLGVGCYQLTSSTFVLA
jgi:hypothetical protein